MRHLDGQPLPTIQFLQHDQSHYTNLLCSESCITSWEWEMAARSDCGIFSCSLDRRLTPAVLREEGWRQEIGGWKRVWSTQRFRSRLSQLAIQDYHSFTTTSTPKGITWMQRTCKGGRVHSETCSTASRLYVSPSIQLATNLQQLYCSRAAQHSRSLCWICNTELLRSLFHTGPLSASAFGMAGIRT